MDDLIFLGSARMQAEALSRGCKDLLWVRVQLPPAWHRPCRSRSERLTCFGHANSTCHLDLQHAGDILALVLGRTESFMCLFVMYVRWR